MRGFEPRQGGNGKRSCLGSPFSSARDDPVEALGTAPVAAHKAGDSDVTASGTATGELEGLRGCETTLRGCETTILCEKGHAFSLA